MTTEIKITIPYWVMLVLCGVIFFNAVLNGLLLQQRYYNDTAFMAKVKEIQKENADLRAALNK